MRTPITRIKFFTPPSLFLREGRFIITVPFDRDQNKREKLQRLSMRTNEELLCEQRPFDLPE